MLENTSGRDDSPREMPILQRALWTVVMLVCMLRALTGGRRRPIERGLPENGPAPENGPRPEDSPRPRLTRRRLVWAGVAALSGLITLAGALVVVVVVRPFAVRVPTATGLWFFGIAALIAFSDQLDRRSADARISWGGEVLHFVSASAVALAFAITAGAFAPSLLGVPDSPSLGDAFFCDLVVGIVAGVLTLALTALSGLAGGRLSALLLVRSRASEMHAKRVRLAVREATTRRDARRLLVMPIAGVMVSGLVEQLSTAAPAQTTMLAADTHPANPSSWGSVIFPLIVWTAVTAVVWFAFALTEPRLTNPHNPQVAPDVVRVHRRRHRATHASALAIALAIGVGFAAAGILDSMIHDSLANAARPVAEVPVPSMPAAARVAFLARTFVPRFELAEGEQWDPTTVTWYVSHSQTVSSQGTSAHPFCLPTKSAPQGCRQLCAVKAGVTCAAVCDAPQPGACAPRGEQSHAVYYIYRDATNTQHDGPAQPIPGWAVIEYWIFYNYDSLHADLITQWHQSDWEQVSVLVQQQPGTVRAIAVAFSEHCYGAVVPASEVHWDGTHPTSFVGLGSHANYPTRDDLPIRELQCLTRRAPRYLGAASLFFNPHVAGWSIEIPIAYFIGLRDRTDRPRVVSDAEPISQASTPSVSAFHGYWGVDNNLQVVAGTLPTGAGPKSPVDQGPSQTPFKSMFCGPSWLKAPSTSDTARMCR